MPLVWVTGSPGVGKSTACGLLKRAGRLAADADFEGFNDWVDRASGHVAPDPGSPLPPGWQGRYSWQISRSAVEEYAARARGEVAFLFGTVENEVAVWDLFDLVVCLVADNQTISDRLRRRTTNAYGKQPGELAAVLGWNDTAEATYRRFGAIIIDGRRPAAEVAAALLAAAEAGCG